MKKILIKIRTSIKFLILISIATFFIIGAVALIYKPIYSVELNGEIIGYCSQKSKLQAKIDDYIENGDGENANVAFVQIDEMPVYDLCLLKRGITTNDEEIFEKIVENGVTYYKYYAISEDDEEKSYVSDFSTAEKVVQDLKDKNSGNVDNIQILEKYETELADFVTEETAVASLYKEKVVELDETKVANISTSSSSGFSTSRNMSRSTVPLGISLIKPVTGPITSRFASMSRVRSGAHTGLDIGASNGTPIKAAAAGTVTFAGTKGSYGKMVVVTHGNGVQTYYAHCSKIYAKVGQTVAQGDTIAAVGHSGNTTGPHLHFEIRVNDVAYNPQNYVY